MKVQMLEERHAALDGVTIVTLDKDGVYDVPDFLAASYLGRGIAKAARADAKLDTATPEEPAGDASEPTGDDEPAGDASEPTGDDEPQASEKPKRAPRANR